MNILSRLQLNHRPRLRLNSPRNIRLSRWHFSAALAAAVSVTGCGAPQAVYTVKVYDPARDPADDLAATVRAAQAANKRIVLQVGGNWCGWCHKLDRYIAEHPAVAEALHDNFVIMKVNRSDENDNAEFLAHYPKIPGYPHWYVLESDGALLYSQGTAELEEGGSYSESALVEFLRAWSGQAV
jgi:thiol:disulfide interchange protein